MMTKWTPEQLALLVALYPTHSAEQIAPAIDKSPTAIRRKAAELGVAKVKHIVKNWRPIGSERMDRGHLIRKVTDTGRPKKDWKRVEVIEWEAVNGPIPAGKVLMVRDSSKPRTLDNLALYTPQEHFQRMSVNNLPPELLALYQLKAKINRRVKGMERAAESEKSETT